MTLKLAGLKIRSISVPVGVEEGSPLHIKRSFNASNPSVMGTF
jgi:hypothetical protein